MDETLPMVIVREIDGKPVTMIIKVSSLVYEIYMNYLYDGPCWRCEGMGV